jgi:hypothetical protein
LVEYGQAVKSRRTSPASQPACVLAEIWRDYNNEVREKQYLEQCDKKTYPKIYFHSTIWKSAVSGSLAPGLLHFDGQGVEAELLNRNPNASFRRQVKVGHDGRFRFCSIPPGTYYLIITTPASSFPTRDVGDVALTLEVVNSPGYIEVAKDGQDIELPEITIRRKGE